MGGDDSPENLIELTVEEHAEAHRELYERYGKLEDYLAWKGLSGLMSKSDILKTLLSEAGKRGLRKRETTNAGIKYNMTTTVATGRRRGEKNGCARVYDVTYPDGHVERVKSLKTWCEAHDLKYNSFHKACIRGGREFRGYRAVRVTGSSI